MADKKAVLVICGTTDITAGGDSTQKFLKKSCNFAGFESADLATAASAIEGAAKVAADGVAKVFEEDGAFAIVELGTVDSSALEAAMAQISEAADRRTLIGVATDTGLYLGGLGMDKKAGTVDRTPNASDVVATLCYVADLPVPANCTGGVLYQALKDPNMKLKEVTKLKEAISRMEVALQRDTREPWDKHDCA